MRDTDTGLTYMQARYYDPVIGRFLSNDPVGFAEGGVDYFNRYAYTANDPINAIDPTGMFVFKFNFNIDIFVPPFPGVSVDLGVYVGTNSSGGIEGGLTGSLAGGTGFDLSAGIEGELHLDNTVESLSGPFVEIEGYLPV